MSNGQLDEGTVRKDFLVALQATRNLEEWNALRNTWPSMRAEEARAYKKQAISIMRQRIAALRTKEDLMNMQKYLDDNQCFNEVIQVALGKKAREIFSTYRPPNARTRQGDNPTRR